jgi:bifunctional UDP-N-acetylglucosamine pyrophosphorylase/glucosamine-1-phosphate N-acetyltransferase
MGKNRKKRVMDDLIYQDKERLKRLYALISRGIKIIDPFTTHIGKRVKIGRGSIIYPLTVIESDVAVGTNCHIGPFCRLRKGTRLNNGVTIGNFVEVNRSIIGPRSKAKHLSYIGDTTIEENVNVGAGTIVANFDGKKKHKTRIKKGAFIGSGSILVAPVRIGRQAVTGAGAVVTKNRHVPDKSVVVGVPAKLLNKKL